MSVASDSPSPGSSPGVGFSTPQAGRDLIHAAQLEQLKEQLGSLDESFPGFGSELQASLPGLPADGSLLKRSRRELASLAMRLCPSGAHDSILTLLSRREVDPSRILLRSTDPLESTGGFSLGGFSSLCCFAALPTLPPFFRLCAGYPCIQGGFLLE